VCSQKCQTGYPEPLLVTQISLDSIAICNSVQKVFSGKCFKQFWTICYSFKVKCNCNKNTYNLIRQRWHGNLKHDIQYSQYLFLHMNRFTSTFRQAACLLGHIWFNRKHWKWISHCCYSFIHIVDTVGRSWQGCLQGLSMTVHFSGYIKDWRHPINKNICKTSKWSVNFIFRGITRLPCALSSAWN